MSHHRSHREHSERESGRMVRTRAVLEIEQASAYLETLAQALRAGGVTIRSGTGLVALSMGNNVEMKLDAGEEGRHSVVHLELRWETPVPEERLEIVAGIEHQRTAETGSATGADDSSSE